MRNNKGFLLYEMIIGISLTLIIAIFLFNMIISISSNTTRMAIKTEVFKEQAIILKMINDDIFLNNGTDIIKNNEYSYTFKFLNTKDKDLIIDIENNTIQYDDYKKVLSDSVQILNEPYPKSYITAYETDKNNALKTLRFKIGNKNLDIEEEIIIVIQNKQ